MGQSGRPKMASVHMSVTFMRVPLQAPRESVPRERKRKVPISQGLGPNTGLVHVLSILLDKAVTEPTQSQGVGTQTNRKNVKIVTIYNLPHSLRKIRKYSFSRILNGYSL